MRILKLLGILAVLSGLLLCGSAFAQDEGVNGGNSDDGGAAGASSAAPGDDTTPADASSEAIVCGPDGKTAAGVPCAAAPKANGDEYRMDDGGPADTTGSFTHPARGTYV